MEPIDISNLQPEIRERLLQLTGLLDDPEPEGEVSYERLGVLNEEVFELRKKLLKAQYDGAVQATDNLIDGIEKEPKQDSKEKTLKMAIVSIEYTIDESKKELMQALLKQKLEARKVVKRGDRNGEDLDMLDAIIAASETEAGYNPVEVQQRKEKSDTPKTRGSGFGFGSNRA